MVHEPGYILARPDAHRCGIRVVRVLIGLVVMSAMIAVAGCGIPQFVFLAPPVLGEVTALPPSLTFSHSPDNDTDSFLGYELYYKLYDPNTAETAFAGDRSAIRSASAATVVTTLGARNYRRVHAPGSDLKPVLRVTIAERGQAFTIALAFQQESPTGGVATWSAGTVREIPLVRDQRFLQPPTPVGFTASALTPATYPDLPARPEPDAGHFLMGLAVVSYGIDFVAGTFGELYSTAIVPEHLFFMRYE